jgi:hypothetical protein
MTIRFRCEIRNELADRQLLQEHLRTGMGGFRVDPAPTTRHRGPAMSVITPESEIEELRLSEHAEKCLHRADIMLVCDLVDAAGAELRVYCDNSAYNEIKARLGEAGLHIGESLE